MPAPSMSYDPSMSKSRKMVGEALRKRRKQKEADRERVIPVKGEPKRAPMTPEMYPSMVEEPAIKKEMSQKKRWRDTLEFFKQRYQQKKDESSRRQLKEALEGYKRFKAKQK